MADRSVFATLSMILVAALSMILVAALPASSAMGGESVQFNRDIRPILAEHCFACHGPDSASREADLRLDQREAALDAGAIVAGDAEASELVARLFADDVDLIMPPPETKKSLSDDEKKLLRRWIEEGAAYEAHWSLIKPAKKSPPAPSDWTKNEIDRFVLARLKQHGLSPAPEAPPRVLFRRLHLDLTGLPPSPELTAQFVADYGSGGDAALVAWIDRLMATEAWGEHRARYWLDAARYGDTHGLHFDNYREMWPYRDWVIRAFNRNLPFDQFTIEQLAGDLLPNPTDQQLIATGFQRCNITTNEGGTIDEENLALYAADRVQTFGWVYLGLTTNCSQCHDHKFDPITMKDYYSLAAFFRNTTQPAKDGNSKDGRSAVLLVPSEADRERWTRLPQEISTAQAKLKARESEVNEPFERWLAESAEAALKDDGLSQGLVTHLPLDEGSGNTVHQVVGDSPEHIEHESLKWAKGGKLGPAPVIEEGKTITLPNAGDFDANQAFSYGAWVKTPRARSAAILARMDVKAKYRGWDLWQDGRAFAVHMIDAWTDNSFKATTKRNAVQAGKWQHVFATYNGSGKANGLKLYVDGKLEQLKLVNNTIQPGASFRTETPFKIGQRSEGQVFAGGSIQDVRIYDRELKAGEISKLAGFATLRRALLAGAKRSPAQRKQLLQHYLQTEDEAYPTLQANVKKLTDEQNKIRARSPITHIQKERPNSSAMAHVLMRGAYDKPGEQVSAATPGALHSMPEGAPNNRLGLARWLVDANNPLTGRVTVNRYWQEVFGRGLVVTAEDFGVTGATPSHPDLLDWLAVDFQQNGWDVKRLFKMMLTSATYRQAAITTPEKQEKDRDNALLSRGPRFRMDAEMVRDYALASSGLLSREMFGPGVKPYQPVDIWEIVGLPGGNTRNYKQDSGDKLYRRTIYSFWKRMAPPPNMEAFNAPSREFCTVRRERTNTPLQALVTLNDPQFVEAARRLAEKALQASDNEEQAFHFIAERVLSRRFNNRELKIVKESWRTLLEHYQQNAEQAKELIAVGESKADASIEASRLAAMTMVCNQILNLDEAINK